jgi:hypothetical protein
MKSKERSRQAQAAGGDDRRAPKHRGGKVVRKPEEYLLALELGPAVDLNRPGRVLLGYRAAEVLGPQAVRRDEVSLGTPLSRTHSAGTRKELSFHRAGFSTEGF